VAHVIHSGMRVAQTVVKGSPSPFVSKVWFVLVCAMPDTGTATSASS
jgi:hypothetical protein